MDRVAVADLPPTQVGELLVAGSGRTRQHPVRVVCPLGGGSLRLFIGKGGGLLGRMALGVLEEEEEA